MKSEPTPQRLSERLRESREKHRLTCPVAAAKQLQAFRAVTPVVTPRKLPKK
jgi:hypothetical protein